MWGDTVRPKPQPSAFVLPFPYDSASTHGLGIERALPAG